MNRVLELRGRAAPLSKKDEPRKLKLMRSYTMGKTRK